MSSEWKVMLVSELADKSPRSTASGPFGSNLVSKDYTDHGIPVIRGKNMSGGRWVDGDFVFVSEKKADQLSSNLAYEGELIFTQRGTLGQVCLIPKSNYKKYVISQSQMKLRVDQDIADPLFMLYQFQSPRQKAYIEMNAIRVGVPHTNLGILRDTPCIIPPLSDQKAIAYVLDNLDRKIELNNKITGNLENIAKTIFKSWFIDFDPVRAKSNKQPTKLSDKTSELFPDSFEDSKLGKIPTSWSTCCLKELGNWSEGKTWKKEFRIESSDIPVFGANGIVGYSSTALSEGRVLFVGKIGTCGAINSFNGKFWASNNTFFLEEKNNPHLEFIRGIIERINFSQYIGGSSNPYMPLKNFGGHMVVIPPKYLMEYFCHNLLPLRKRIENLTKESFLLLSLRNLILPKLISGELKISDAEKMIEEVGI